MTLSQSRFARTYVPLLVVAWIQFTALHFALGSDATRGRIDGQQFYFQAGASEYEVSPAVFIGSLVSWLFMLALHTSLPLADPTWPTSRGGRAAAVFWCTCGGLGIALTFGDLVAAIRAVS